MVAVKPTLTLLGQNLLSEVLGEQGHNRLTLGFLYLVRMALKDGTKISNYYYSKGGDFFGTVIESVGNPWIPGFKIKIHPDHSALIKQRHRDLVIPSCLLPDIEFFAATVDGEQ